MLSSGKLERYLQLQKRRKINVEIVEKSDAASSDNDKNADKDEGINPYTDKAT